jgi:hypothetical protein
MPIEKQKENQEAAESQGAAESQAQGAQPQVLKIGEKEYSPETIQQLEQKAAQAKKIVDNASRYGLSIDDYMANTDMALHTVSDLIEQGVIDQQGRRVQSTASDTPKRSDVDLSGVESQQDRGAISGHLKRLEAVEQALSALTPDIESVKQSQMQLIRKEVANDLIQRYPTLTSDDVGKVFVKAMNDKTMSLEDHAQAYAQQKKEYSAAYRRKVLEELGMDPDKVEERNQLRQQGSGGAGRLFQGKKFSFKRGKDTMSPQEAARRYLEAKGS